MARRTINDLVSEARARHLAETGEAQRIRERAGVSMSAVGDAVGVSHVAIRRWEHGERRPSGARAARYAAVLDALDEATR